MRIKALSVGLAAVLAFGCTDQATSPTAQSDVAVAPSFNFLNGPDNPGNSPVFRFEDYGALSITDFDQGLRVRLYDTFNTFLCGGPADFPFWSYQDVDKDRLVSVSMNKEVPIVVYPFPNAPKPFCDFLADDWLYRGMGQVHAQDNNLFWFTGTGGNNTFSTHATGTVWDRAGNQYSLVARSHVVVKGLCCFPFIPLADEDFEVLRDVQWIKINGN